MSVRASLPPPPSVPKQCLSLPPAVCCRYESGDHVAVFPTNDTALVNRLGHILGVDLDVIISLNNLDGRHEGHHMSSVHIQG